MENNGQRFFLRDFKSGKECERKILEFGREMWYNT
jgi:hypothetical protein